MIQTSYHSLLSALNSFTRAGGAASRIVSLLDSQPHIDPTVGRKLDLQGSLELKDVCFTYQMRPNQPVLRGVNLQVRSGGTLAIVGKSGGGKSTIINLLMRFYDPTSGEVLLDGVPLRDQCLQHVHGAVGLVQQETPLFAATIRENIAYGLDDEPEGDEEVVLGPDGEFRGRCPRRVVEAAREANAHEFIASFEDGYDTQVGERGVRLSGGQKQRIALARVFLRRPKLLFLDEATSALDAESEAQVQEALDRLIRRGGSTVVLVAHRLSTVMDADQIAVVDGGRIAESGTHSELVERGGIYGRLVARQLSRAANQLGEPPSAVDELFEATDVEVP